MKLQFHKNIGPLAALLLGCAAAMWAGPSAAANGVAPPPLPAGSEKAKPHAGEDHHETKRGERAHHHKFQIRKDVTRDDTIFGDPSEEAAAKDKQDKVGKAEDNKKKN